MNNAHSFLFLHLLQSIAGLNVVVVGVRKFLNNIFFSPHLQQHLPDTSCFLLQAAPLRHATAIPAIILLGACTDVICSELWKCSI